MTDTDAAKTLPLNQPQYLFDDEWIDRQVRLVRRWLPAEVNPDPVLVQDKPWEEGGLVFHGSILPDQDGGYRMYYKSFLPREGPRPMLATSRDGVQWEKPELGLVEYGGKRDNNLLFYPDRHLDSACYIPHPEDSDHPYKMICFQRDGERANWRDLEWGMVAWQSTDGLRWHAIRGTRSTLGDRCSLYRDSRTGRFVLLSRNIAWWPELGGRHLARSESEDFLTWSEPELLMAMDLDDEPDIEFYGMPVFERHGWYIGLLEYWSGSRDIMDVHLAVSRDSRNWLRPMPRRPFIAASEPWNRRWSSCANEGPLILDDVMAFYFGGRRFSHNWNRFSRNGVIGCATLTLDRFCAIEGGWDGRFTTPPLVWPGGDLVVNADTRQSFESHPLQCNGRMEVEVLDAHGDALPDWSDARKAFFHGNTHCRGTTIDGAVRWPDERSLSALSGQTLRLRFHLDHTRLYTFMARSAERTS